jgi:hypothetical protein
MDTLTSILSASWRVTVEMAGFLFVGFLAAGLIRAFLRPNLVSRHLGERSVKSVLKASLVGVPLPLCSCSVLPVAATLRKQGAGRGAVTSFLVSTPESGVDSIAVSWALLDPLLTVARPIAAFLTAFVAGMAENLFGGPSDEPSAIELPAGSCCAAAEPPAETSSCCSTAVPSVKAEKSSCCSTEIAEEQTSSCCSTGTESDEGGKPLGARLLEGMAFVWNDLIPMLAGWLLLMIVLTGALEVLLPESWLSGSVGSGWIGMVVMLLLSVPIYVCATSTTPIAAALIMKGLSPGAAMVFLLAGPATNLATIGVVKSMLGKRAAVIYVTAIAVMALLIGWTTNALYGWLQLTPAMRMSGEHHHLMNSGLVGTLLGALLLGICLAGFGRRLFARGSHGAATQGAANPSHSHHTS